MEVTLRYDRDDDVMTVRLATGGTARRVALADDIEATVDSDRRIHSLNVRNFSRFHDFLPLLHIIGGDGISAIADFQADVRQGRQQRTVTLNPKPLSRRAVAALPAA